MRVGATYTPFTPCVDHSVTQHKTTVAADKVATAELLDDVRIRVIALRAYEANGEVRAKGGLELLCFSLCEWEGAGVGHVETELVVRSFNTQTGANAA